MGGVLRNGGLDPPVLGLSVIGTSRFPFSTSLYAFLLFRVILLTHTYLSVP